MPILSLPGAEGHLSLGPTSKLPGGWSPGFWSHLCFELALPPGWVTIPPSPGLSCCNVRNGGQIPDTKISHHKERLEVQTNVEPVSGCLTSLCPLVDTSGLAPGGNRLETPELCQGSPSLRSNPHLLNVDNNNTYLLGLLLRMQRDNTWEMHEKCLDFRSEHRLVNQQKPYPTTEMANPIISEECNDYKL